MNLHDQIPVLILHVLEANVAQNTGIIDEDVNPAKILDCSLDDPITIFDAVVVGHCLSAGGFDLVDDDIRRLNWDRLAEGAREQGTERGDYTFVELPSPLKEPPRSLTTTLAPREPKKVA